MQIGHKNRYLARPLSITKLILEHGHLLILLYQSVNRGYDNTTKKVY
jgi:hypothetical protein